MLSKGGCNQQTIFCWIRYNEIKFDGGTYSRFGVFFTASRVFSITSFNFKLMFWVPFIYSIQFLCYTSKVYKSIAILLYIVLFFNNICIYSVIYLLISIYFVGESIFRANNTQRLKYRAEIQTKSPEEIRRLLNQKELLAE